MLVAENISCKSPWDSEAVRIFWKKNLTVCQVCGGEGGLPVTTSNESSCIVLQCPFIPEVTVLLKATVNHLCIVFPVIKLVSTGLLCYTLAILYVYRE